MRCWPISGPGLARKPAPSKNPAATILMSSTGSPTGGIRWFGRYWSTRRNLSERRRCAGADHLARLGADAAEAMRPAAFEVIGVAGAEDAAFALHRHFQPARQHD